MASVNTHREEIADGIGDPYMRKVYPHQLLNFINRAVRDLSNSGWLLPQEHAESIELLSNEYEYDVPALFAYVKELRIGNRTLSNASPVDTGVTLGAAITSTTATTITVSDSSIFAVNDLIQVDDEIMLVAAVPSSTTLTVSRGYYSSTAATHLISVAVERPNADIAFDTIIPRAYWRLKLQAGGANTTTAALGSRPQFVFNSDYFSFTAGTPLQVIGQRRPTVYTAGSDTVDAHMESFIVERATAYAARFLYAQGEHPHLNQVYRESWVTSEAFLGRHPAEFRVRPNSTRVPGR